MSSERDTEILRFLGDAGWGDAAREPLAGDASSRRYERLRLGSETRVLMDAPGAQSGNARFVAVAEHLRDVGLSVPRIFDRDLSHGLMLLEDFGDNRYPELLDADPAREQPLFEAATDVLAYDGYLPAVTGHSAPEARREMQALMAAAFDALPHWTPVLALRDYHAGNLFWLPDRAGAARVGLIDFQDAGLGHPLYDLVSLARDARRDVARDTVAAMQARYAAATGIDPGAAWPLLAVQRNLRILGIFARLALGHGKPGYLDFLPRTWALMVEDLDHGSLTRLKDRLMTDLPPQTPELIAKLKDRCRPDPTR